MRSSSATDRLTAVLSGLPARAGAGAHAPAPRSFPRRPREAAWLASVGGEPGEAWASPEVVLAASTVISAAIVLYASRLRRLAATDALTGLANRGAFDERLRAEWSQARRHRRPLSLALLDVDHFKRFNNTHGHTAGDAALRMVAAELRATFRASDLVARYGGEEFAILLPETPADAALAKLQEVCARLVATRMLIGRTKTARLTASAGVAAWPDDDQDLERWVALAGERLYVAKAGGGNRVVGGAEVG